MDERHWMWEGALDLWRAVHAFQTGFAGQDVRRNFAILISRSSCVDMIERQRILRVSMSVWSYCGLTGETAMRPKRRVAGDGSVTMTRSHVSLMGTTCVLAAPDDHDEKLDDHCAS